MILALTLLLLFQLVGEILVLALALPVPGPVVGMALLFLVLMLRGSPGEPLRQISNHLLRHLSLLFVPAGTGIVLYGALLYREWLPLTLALVASTLLGIAVTALLLQFLIRRRRESGSEAP